MKYSLMHEFKTVRMLWQHFIMLWMQLLILFCLQKYLMNHFIFSEFTGVFPFSPKYMTTVLQVTDVFMFIVGLLWKWLFP